MKIENHKIDFSFLVESESWFLWHEIPFVFENIKKIKFSMFFYRISSLNMVKFSINLRSWAELANSTDDMKNVKLSVQLSR